MGIFDFLKRKQQPKIAEKQDGFSEQIELAKAQLASYFSQEIVDNAYREFNMCCRIEGLRITAETDFGRRTTIVQAKNNDELFFKITEKIAETCAQKYELIHRESNSKKWHYVRANAVNGHWMYKENADYKYDAIEDTRKVWFEKHIGAMSALFSVADAHTLIAKYTTLMNVWFSDTHWEFNSELMEFVEISSSREIDTDKKEHPQPNEMLK